MTLWQFLYICDAVCHRRCLDASHPLYNILATADVTHLHYLGGVLVAYTAQRECKEIAIISSRTTEQQILILLGVLSSSNRLIS